MREATCPSCGASGPAGDGAVHPDMLAPLYCWRRFNAIMAREDGTPELMPAHDLAVDASALRHPGDPANRRARQSVWLHQAGLDAVLRPEREAGYRDTRMRSLADTVAHWPPPPPHAPFAMVAGTISAALPVAQPIATMRDRAKAAPAAYEAATPDLSARLRALG